MAIRYRDLRQAFTTSPPIEALTGGRLARADRVLSVHRQADDLLGNDRGVVARVGLHGASAFQVVSLDPVNAAQLYPLRSVYRTVARVPAFSLLPGHFLRLSALVEPAGMTSKPAGDGTWKGDAAYGEIAAVVTWGGPSADTTTHKLVLTTSGETFAGEDPAAGAAWAGLRRVGVPLMFPDSVSTSAGSVRTWSEGTTAEVVIKFKGGVRCVDLVLQQVPYAYARNVGTDTLYTSTLVTDGVGASVKTYPVAYPIEERSATDPTYGSALLADIADRQHHLGPVLAHWTAWDESAAVSETDLPSVTTTSTTFVDMLRTSVTAWASTAAGWSLSAGSTAQQFKTSNARRELRGLNACLPVRVWAYCARVGTGSAVLRFQSADHSVAELEVTSSTPAWRSVTGYLRCGAHPQDPSVLQVLGRATSGAGSNLSLSSLLVEFLDL